MAAPTSTFSTSSSATAAATDAAVPAAPGAVAAVAAAAAAAADASPSPSSSRPGYVHARLAWKGREPIPLPFYQCGVDVLAAGAGGEEADQRTEAKVAGVAAVQEAVHEFPVRVVYRAEEHLLDVVPVGDAEGGEEEEEGEVVPYIHAGYRCPLRRMQAAFAAGDESHEPLVSSTSSPSSPSPAEVSHRALRGALQWPAPRVRVATSVVVEDDAGRVLLTRRAPHMFSFPGVWVLPGGHVDAGEASLAVGAVREVQEETGLVVAESDVRVLSAYESCSPVLIEGGVPRHRHVIVYMHARVRSSSPVSDTEDALCRTLELQASEVDAAAWLTAEELALAYAASTTAEFQTTGEERRAAQAAAVAAAKGRTVRGLHNAGTMDAPIWETTDIPLENLMEQDRPDGSLNNHRISTGTRLALLRAGIGRDTTYRPPTAAAAAKH